MVPHTSDLTSLHAQYGQTDCSAHSHTVHNHTDYIPLHTQGQPPSRGISQEVSFDIHLYHCDLQNAAARSHKGMAEGCSHNAGHGDRL